LIVRSAGKISLGTLARRNDCVMMELRDGLDGCLLNFLSVRV